MENTNKTLLSLQNEWIRLIADPFVQNERTEHFSNPFHLGLSKELDRDKKLVMLIGQEARNFDPYGNNAYNPISLQEWAINFFDKQIFDRANGECYNRSPFWNFFRSIHKSGLDVCWNNLDKLHRYTSNNKTKPLRLRHELELSRQYGPDNKSLLQREIDVVKPYAVVFLTGPSYVDSMACAFGLTPRILTPFKPNKENLLWRIEHVIGLDIPVFWTYHPKYLNFKSGYTSKVITDIINSLT